MELFLVGCGIGVVLLIASGIVVVVSWIAGRHRQEEYLLGRINRCFDRIAAIEQTLEKRGE